jgi:hypothetical protein
MGTYAESLLTADERIVMRQRQHWLALILDSWLAIVLWGATIVLLIIQVLLPEEISIGGLATLSFAGGSILGESGRLLTLLTLLGGVIVVAVRWWWWQTQEFLVTTRRLILAWGVVSKSSSDSSLEKINDLQLDVSLMGRLLDYGSLKVMTAAPLQGAEYLDRLAHAKEFKKTLMSAKHALLTGLAGEDHLPSRSRAASAAPSPAGAASVTTRPADAPAATGADASGAAQPPSAQTPDEVAAVVAQLATLRDQGHISEAEYEAKKQELLARL